MSSTKQRALGSAMSGSPYWTWYTRDVLADEIDEDPASANELDEPRGEMDYWYRKHASAHITSLQGSNARLIERIRQIEQDLLTEQACRKIAETANEAMAKRIADVGAAAKWLRDNVEFLQITPATVVAYDSGRGLEDGCEVCRGQLASDTGEAFCDALIELAKRGGGA